MQLDLYRYCLLKKLAYQQPWKLFYTGLFSRKIRQYLWKNWIDNYEQSVVAKKWRGYLCEPVLESPQIKIKKKEINSQGRKIIWQYWGQGIENAPSVVQFSYASVEHFCQEYYIIRLDDNKVSDYLEFPDFVENKKKSGDFKVAHYSDLLRVALLYAYGGVWLDATVFLTAPFPAEYLREEIFMFSRDKTSPYKALWEASHPYFDWSEQARVRHLNSVMVGQKSNLQLKLLQDLLLIYWKNETHYGHYFFFQILCSELLSKKLALSDMPIVDDAAPHLLSKIIDNKLNQIEVDNSLLASRIHKMNYNNKLQENLGGSMSNFSYLKCKLKI